MEGWAVKQTRFALILALLAAPAWAQHATNITNVQVKSTAISKTVVSWTLPTTAVTGVLTALSGVGGGVCGTAWSSTEETLGSGATTRTFSGLTLDQRYCVHVTAVYGDGTSTVTATAMFTATADPPSGIVVTYPDGIAHPRGIVYPGGIVHEEIIVNEGESFAWTMTLTPAGRQWGTDRPIGLFNGRDLTLSTEHFPADTDSITGTLTAREDADCDDEVLSGFHFVLQTPRPALSDHWSGEVGVTILDDDTGCGSGGGGGSGGRPAITGVTVASDPGGDGRYTDGETIVVEVTFSVAMRADAGATLELDLGGAEREAMLAADDDPADATLTFRYLVTESDRDADGFGVPADALAANGRAIRGREGNRTADLDLGAHAIRAAAGHPVGPASVALLPSAANPERQGFVRVINHSDEAGEVTVRARDDAGVDHDPVTFPIAARSAFHFNSTDLERGNAAKGLEGATGAGTGHWRLELTSERDIEALAYVRNAGGPLTSMHEVAPREDGRARLATLNPGSNRRNAGWVRLSHRGDEALAVRMRAADDTGAEPGGAVDVDLAPRGAVQHSSAALEAGTGVSGDLGDGTGKWRLRAHAPAPFTLMGLIWSSSGHLANLSEAGLEPVAGTVVVPLFLSGADAIAPQGLLRVLNRSDEAGTVEIHASDDGAMDAGPVVLSIGAGESVQIRSRDLEQGNTDKGLHGAAGPARTWHRWLRLRSTLDYEVLAYARHADGFLTALHPSVPVWEGVHRVATFNPASNSTRVSFLHLVNTGSEDTVMRIRGIDDAGASSAGTVEVTVPAGGASTFNAQALESGGEDFTGFTGALGDGRGKWRLLVEPVDAPHAPVHVLSLLRSASGHLTNLSTRTATRE